MKTTIEYKGVLVKIKDGKIFLRARETTTHNHSMREWMRAWMEVKASDLKPELCKLLKAKGLI